MQNFVQRVDFFLVELSTLMIGKFPTVFSVILIIVGACYTVDCFANYYILAIRIDFRFRRIELSHLVGICIY